MTAAQKGKGPVETNVGADAGTAFQGKGPSSKAEVTERLQALFRTLPKDVFALPPHEKHTHVVSFLKTAEAAGIEVHDAMHFLKRVRYAYRISHWSRREKDQVPTLFVLANTSHVGLNGAVVGKPEFRDGVQYGGVFGNIMNARKTRHFNSGRDLTPIAYMVGHLLEHGREFPPYLWVLGEYDSAAKGTPNADYTRVLELALQRRNGFEKEARAAGFVIEDHVLKVAKEGEAGTKKIELPLMVVVYHAQERTFHAITQDKETGAVSAHPFEGYVAKNPSLSGNPIVQEQLRHMKYHRTDSGYSEYRPYKRFSKTTMCVDARSYMPDSGGAVKVIGSVLPEEDFIRIAKDPSLKVVHINYHVPCGYMGSAIAIHGVFREISAKIDRHPELGAEVFRKIGAIMRGEKADLDAATCASVMGLSKGASDTLAATFGPKGDLRNILRHMYEQEVFTSGEACCEMTAAAAVEAKLNKFGIDPASLSKLHYTRLVIEEFARMDEQRKLRAMETHREEIEAERGKGNMPKLVVAMEDYVTGRVTLLPPALTKRNALDTHREDSFLNETVQVVQAAHGHESHGH